MAKSISDDHRSSKLFKRIIIFLPSIFPAYMSQKTNNPGDIFMLVLFPKIEKMMAE